MPMPETIAQPVYNAFNRGLDLLDRLNQDADELDFQREQGILKEAIARVPNIGEETEGFFGIRYPLICWADEIIIRDSPWGERWAESSLEGQRFGSNERAYRFWEQAEIAEGRIGAEALEVFYLAVMLGFRGSLQDNPEELQAWFKRVKPLFLQRQTYPLPPASEIQTRVYPLTGAQRKQSMILLAGLSVLALIPLAVFYFLFQFRN